MEGAKSIFSSKTFWGAILAVAAGILGIFGYKFTPEDQVAVIEIVSAVALGVGSLFAIYGRIKAEKKIE